MLENLTEVDREKTVLFLLNAAMDIFDNLINDSTVEDTLIRDNIDMAIVSIENRIKITEHIKEESAMGHIWCRQNDDEILICEMCGQGEEALDLPCPGPKSEGNKIL
jgi:hypothetical protein